MKQSLINVFSLDNKPTKAVLIANMGAPVSEPDMKVFLKRMFSDKAIIFAPKFIRIIVSTVISNFRYKSSWKKYMKIGGSPLQHSMNKFAEDLQTIMGNDIIIKPVYSYSKPFIELTISELYYKGINDITVISMYPQSSFSTTGSVQKSLNKMLKKHANIKLRFIEDYYENELFINYWTKLINQVIKINNYQRPYLLFSSHAIPQSFIKRGDKYTEKMQISAQLIANSIQLPYTLAYQSKIGSAEWTRPYTIDILELLSTKNIDEIIIIPLSFINENLETRYDLDTELIPYAKGVLGIKRISRISIPESDISLTTMFYNLLKQ